MTVFNMLPVPPLDGGRVLVGILPRPLAFQLAKLERVGIFLVIGVLFLLPACLLLCWLSWPFFMQSFNVNEHSNNAGGLLRWPVKFLLPLGFALVALQGFSELIKRVAAL